MLFKHYNQVKVILSHKKTYVYTIFNPFSIKSYTYFGREGGRFTDMLKGCKLKDAVSLTELYTMSRQRFSGGYFFKGESHPFYEAVVVLKGRVGITAGKRVFVLNAKQMTVHPPGEFHAIWEEGRSAPEVIIFSFSAAPFPKLKGYVFELSSDLVRSAKAVYDDINEVFDIVPPTQALTEAIAENSGRTVLSDGLTVSGVKEGMEHAAFRAVKRMEIFLSSAIEKSVELSEENKGKGSENYAKILSVMEENIDGNLSASELAALCKMSVPTLEKTVFRYLHSGAMAYYGILRMEKAYSLLLSGVSVKETALTLGYANQNYFSACFKKRYGFPPSEVKKNIE